MRVLITTPPGLGHVHPMVPLARAIRDRGHDVLWATGPELQDGVRGAGFQAIVAGLRSGEAAQEFWRSNPEARTLAPEQIPDVMFPKMFGAVAAPAMLEDLLPIAQEWRPQLVVHDAAEFAGPIVASALGVASVTKSFGALLPRHRVAAAAEAVAPLWRGLGLEPPPFAGCYEHLYVDIYPVGLQPPLPDYVGRSQALRPVPYDVADDGPADVPLPGGSDRLPLIYLTMGTVFSNAPALRQAVDALASLDARVLVTVGPSGDPADLGDPPPHVRVERYVPQTLVLDRCAVVISHGGSGTVLAALAHGVPQLCLPQGADQFLNAAALAAAGAALTLTPPEASVAAIAQATRRLLDEPGFGLRAASLGGEIASMPGPDEVAAVLEQLA